VSTVAGWRRECLKRGDDHGLKIRDRLQRVLEAGTPMSSMAAGALVLEHVEEARQSRSDFDVAHRDVERMIASRKPFRFRSNAQRVGIGPHFASIGEGCIGLILDLAAQCDHSFG
jgi:hypothetical protein